MSFKSYPITYFFLLISAGCFGHPPALATDTLNFIVSRTSEKIPAQEKARIVLDVKEINKHLGVGEGAYTVLDLNFGSKTDAQVSDSNNDGKPDQVYFDFTFLSNEPIFTFSLIKANRSSAMTPAMEEVNEKFKVSFLTKVIAPNSYNWPEKIIASLFEFYPDPAQLTFYAPGKWNYEPGIFLSAVFNQWKKTKKDEYYQYIKKWEDRFIDSNGLLAAEHYDPKEYRLDDIIPGRPVLFLYESSHDARYKKVADQLADQLLHQPKNGDGGYWHKLVYPNQMWLDGTYMGGVFSAQYGSVFGKPEFVDEAIRQALIIYQHTYDPTTGLLYHGWDESKNKVWAHPEKGTSPSFWGRAIGWYMMALVEILDYTPANHVKRKELISILQKLSASILRYQDAKSGLWYQVIDKGTDGRNWLETSCSAMFAYSFAKGQRMGYLDASYRQAASRAFDELVKNYTYLDEKGRVYFLQTVKIGTLNPKVSNGDYDSYIITERRINDFKGLGAWLYLAIELREGKK